MIEPGKRKAIYHLHQEGMGILEISRQLAVSKNTVKAIIKQKGETRKKARTDRIEIDPEVLRKLHRDCEGWVQRIYEKLSEEMGIKIGYSTLTRLVREIELGKPKQQRCGQVPDKPGAEFQHDTTTYTIGLGTKKVKVVASLLYFRYSKIRYLKFYRSFNRFKMKCFLHEGLIHWGYCAPDCIIDNTNLARLHGTGKNAVIVPEMEQFGKRYGYGFVCHEKGHANRKAGNEKSFYTVETNFLPGRKFENMQDLNQQAFEWATVRMPNRPVAKTGLIPAKAFEYEQSYLIKLPAYVTPPYLSLSRGTDQYGYIPVDGNFYWVPGTNRFEVIALKYADTLEIYHQRKLLGTYDLASEDVKNQRIPPKGQLITQHQPRHRKKPTASEEKSLRALSSEVDDYLTFAVTGAGRKQHGFIRRLYGLSRKITPSLFIETIARTHKYRITDIDTIERIAVLKMQDSNVAFPDVSIDREFETRPAYQEGRISDVVDLTRYDAILEEDDDG